MRKLLLLVLILFVLCGCNKGGENPEPTNNNNNTGAPENNVEQGSDFPFSEMEGYWTCTKGNAYLQIYKNESGDYVFEEGNFADFSTGEIRIESIEKTAEKTYYFKTLYYDMGDLKGDKIINIENLDMYKIFVEEDEYVYCGPDFYQATLANNQYVTYSYVEKLMGYWNSDSDNAFVCFGANPDGTFFLTPGLYDSEPGGSWRIDFFELIEGNKYRIHVYSPEDENINDDYEIDLSNVESQKLTLEGLGMHYAGEDFDTAYADYQKMYQ